MNLRMKFVRLLTVILLAALLLTAAATDLIDINRATAAELKTLPGIADAYSAAIIKNRPYKNKTQLRSKGVIPLAAYNKIKDRIIAKQ